LKTESAAATLGLGYRLAQLLAAKITKFTEEGRLFITTLQQVIEKLKSEGNKPWIEALEIIALNLTGYNIAGQLPKLSNGVGNNKQQILVPVLCPGPL
jgi:hypothetical protein